MKTCRSMIPMLALMVVVLSASGGCGKDSDTLPPPSSGSVTKPGNTDMSQIYDYVQSFQLSYIRSLQLPGGAIKDNESANSKITPYFANFAAMALLTEPSEENQKAVRDYMLWYFGKLNGTETDFRDDEIAGSVYDYFAPSETTRGTYDSVDSYAATFLETVMRYAMISDSNEQWLAQYKEKISSVAGAMLKTMDYEGNSLPGGNLDDCLSIAHYRYPVKYLMDNSEVNMGLKAAIWLEEHSLLDTGADLGDLLRRNTEAIGSLFNEKNGNYDYAKGSESDWSVFYPGATAQLYPCLFGVASPLETRSRQLYAEFNANYPDWAAGTTYDAYPWTMVVYAAAVMNDAERVDSYVTHIYGMNIRDEQKAYWYDAEAGSLVLAIDTIRKMQNNHKIDSK